MSLFGLLLCGLGMGYAVHKGNQKFANMRADAVYRLGFKPSHMATMSSPLNGHGLYFYTGSWGAAMDYPTECDDDKLANENPFKYLAVYEVDDIEFRRI